MNRSVLVPVSSLPTPWVGGELGVCALQSGAKSKTIAAARKALPALVKKFPKMKLASIGPETSKALLALGLKPQIEAKDHTAEGLITELLRGAKS